VLNLSILFLVIENAFQFSSLLNTRIYPVYLSCVVNRFVNVISISVLNPTQILGLGYINWDILSGLTMKPEIQVLEW
jgi:hypothetical protein